MVLLELPLDKSISVVDQNLTDIHLLDMAKHAHNTDGKHGQGGIDTSTDIFSGDSKSKMTQVVVVINSHSRRHKIITQSHFGTSVRGIYINYFTL